MTAIEWLEKEIKSLTGLNIPETVVKQAKEIELEQRKEYFRIGWNANKHKTWNCEFYLIKHFNNDFKSK